MVKPTKSYKLKTKNSTLTIQEVRHVAQLANLTLTDQELKLFQTQLSDILEYVNQLQKVNTDGIKPTSQVTGLTNVIREDNVKTSLTQSQALSTAPKTKDGYIQVPGILNST